MLVFVNVTLNGLQPESGDAVNEACGALIGGGHMVSKTNLHKSAPQKPLPKPPKSHRLPLLSVQLNEPILPPGVLVALETVIVPKLGTGLAARVPLVQVHLLL